MEELKCGILARVVQVLGGRDDSRLQEYASFARMSTWWDLSYGHSRMDKRCIGEVEVGTGGSKTQRIVNVQPIHYIRKKLPRSSYHSDAGRVCKDEIGRTRRTILQLL